MTADTLLYVKEEERRVLMPDEVKKNVILKSTIHF